MEDNKSRNFKVIGIRPLKGCNKHILKNLEEESFYSFYNNYKYTDGKILRINPNIPNGFYAPNINIHAIVGINGSGKSTVVEILMRIINNIAYNVIGKQKSYAADELIPIKKLRAELYYELDEKIYCVKVNDEKYEWYDENHKSYGDSTTDLQHLFYTLVVNYSHYAYNAFDYKSEILGRYKNKFWIESIFHKNDGYKTPIVLNPYRDKGNININSETELASQRLISLFMLFELNNGLFHPDYPLHSFELKYHRDKIEAKIKKAENEYWPQLEKIQKIDFKTASEFILESWSTLFINNNKDAKVKELSEKYLIYKTISIILKYDLFYELYKQQSKLKENKDDTSSIFKFIVSRIKEDTSHITLKLRQLISFLQHNGYDTGIIGKKQLLNMFKKWLPNEKTFPLSQLMDLLPPPIFKTTFFLSHKTENSRIAKIPITDLSSGERQMLYSLSSVLYHLQNFNSIEGNRITYNNYLIILEEIELYYHPDYQRKYVQNLIDYINVLGLKQHKRIDILIITHSPFVLSDIPKENILFLEKGKPRRPDNEDDTFSANFYDLLRYDFFLKDNAIGLLAEKKLGIIADICNNKNRFYQLTEEEKHTLRHTIELIGDKFMRGYFTDKLNSFK